MERLDEVAHSPRDCAEQVADLLDLACRSFLSGQGSSDGLKFCLGSGEGCGVLGHIVSGSTWMVLRPHGQQLAYELADRAGELAGSRQGNRLLSMLLRIRSRSKETDELFAEVPRKVAFSLSGRAVALATDTRGSQVSSAQLVSNLMVRLAEEGLEDDLYSLLSELAHDPAVFRSDEAKRVLAEGLSLPIIGEARADQLLQSIRSRHK